MSFVRNVWCTSISKELIITVAFITNRLFFFFIMLVDLRLYPYHEKKLDLRRKMILR